MQVYRVLLAEDRVIHRLYLEQVIRDSGRYTLVGAEPNMEEAVNRYRHTPIDLILMAAADKEGTTNFAAAAEYKKQYSSVRIVVMTASAEHSYPERAEDSGADSFWYMESMKGSILSVMDRTMEGRVVWPEHLPSVKVGQMESRDLSGKELAILREVAKGYSNKEIAKTLQMSYYTVRDYVKGMLEKTGLPSRTALAVEAVNSGLIVLENRISETVR